MGTGVNESLLNATVVVLLGLLTIPYAWFFGLGLGAFFTAWVFVSLTYLVGPLVYPLSPGQKIEER